MFEQWELSYSVRTEIGLVTNEGGTPYELQVLSFFTLVGKPAN